MHKFQALTVITGMAVLTLAACGPKPEKTETATETVIETTGPGEAMPMKAGLWELSTTVAGMTVGGVKMCVDDVMAKDIAWKNKDTSPENCEKFDIKKTSSGADIDMVCTREGQKVEAVISYTVTGDSAFHQTMTAKTGQGDVTTTTDGKWTGACPADMTAGDIVLPGGMKVNAKNH